LAENHRLLFINIFRPGYLENKIDKITNIGQKLPVYFVEIILKPLGINDSKALIHNMLAIKGLPFAFRDRIIEKTGGNPYFIEEVIRSLIDDGTIVQSQTGFRATQGINYSIIPSTINDVLITRIDRLDEQTKELVKVASVIGRSFFDRIIKDIAFSINDVDDRLAYLKDIQLIRDRIRMQELEYLFKHALAQEAVYDSILSQQKKALHLLVAQSIEKVFSKRLNEFYGMLAFHYNKAEELGKTEEFMIKAGDEALKSSASNEALNYFQEALNIYLGRIGADADPERLIAFEKKIAIAFFNKGNFANSVEYFDRVLTKLGDNLPKTKIGKVLNLLHGASIMLVSLYLPFLKGSKTPTEQDNEKLNLSFKRNIALVHTDHIRAFSGCLKLAKSTNCFDAPLLENSTQMLISFGGHLVFSGISSNLSKKVLDTSIGMINQSNVRDLISYRAMKTMFRLYSGTWDELGDYEEQLIDDSLRNGDLWAVCAYILSYGLIKSEQGKFQEVESLTNDLLEISNAYGYKIAKIYYYILKIDLYIKTKDYNQTSIISESAFILATQTGMEMNQIQFVSYKAISEIMLNELDRAKDLVEQSEKLFGNQKFLPPLFITPYYLGQILFNIKNLTQIIESDNQLGLIDVRKKTYKCCRAALKISKKYVPHRVGILKIVGLYYWLLNKQSKAIRWWNKSINEGERLGARLDLCRTYFEVGKRLLEPKSNYKEVNGIDARGYLDKAKAMFEEMDLQNDLDELDLFTYTL
jgi:tetratricopeptide (TPR) repeat protein